MVLQPLVVDDGVCLQCAWPPLSAAKGVGGYADALAQQFSTFLMLLPFNTVAHAVVTPSHKIISLLLHNCMNHNVNTHVF